MITRALTDDELLATVLEIDARTMTARELATIAEFLHQRRSALALSTESRRSLFHMAKRHGKRPKQKGKR